MIVVHSRTHLIYAYLDILIAIENNFMRALV